MVIIHKINDFLFNLFYVIDPFLDMGMNFKREYEMAKEMFVKREGK